jgi:YidC/Oxa1 family membrane protein insertase
MFTTFIVQPIFNLLVLIYALIPGHNFGLAIIIFTVIVRVLLWPLVKKQLNHAKAIRELAPEIKKIKQQAAGDKQKERMLIMELYKEREVNPLASIGIIAVQAVIFIGLYLGLSKVIKDPQQIISFSYSPLHDLGWMKTLSVNINQFDATLFGVIDLHRTALGQSGFYLPATLLAVGSAVAQFFQGRQLMPKSENARSLRQILKEAGQGKQAEQQEVSAAVGRSTLYILPLFVFLVSLNFPAALPLYWFTGSLFAIWQQGRILKEDVEEASKAPVKKNKNGIKVTYRTEPVSGISRSSSHRKNRDKRHQRRRRRKS